MNRWDFFLGLMALLIVETVMVPQVFGLMHFTQWGGMYTDGWCQVHATSALLGEPHEEMSIRAGSVPGKRLVEKSADVSPVPSKLSQSIPSAVSLFSATSMTRARIFTCPGTRSTHASIAAIRATERASAVT